MTLQVGVKVFLKNKEGKYLLLKRSAEKYKNTKGVWDIVGGRIIPGTKLLENLRREVMEETGLEMVTEPEMVYAQDIIPNEEIHVVRITFKAETENEPVLDLSENVEYRWLTVNEMLKQDDLDMYVKEILSKGLVR